MFCNTLNNPMQYALKSFERKNSNMKFFTCIFLYEITLAKMAKLSWLWKKKNILIN